MEVSKAKPAAAGISHLRLTQRYFSSICVNLAKNKETETNHLFASTFSSHSVHFPTSFCAPVIIIVFVLFFGYLDIQR